LAIKRNVLSASSIFPLLAKYIGDSGIHTNKRPNKINGETVAPNKTLHELFGKIAHANSAEIMLPNDQKNSNDDKYTPLFLLGKNSAHKLYATGTPPNPNPTSIRAKHSPLNVGASADPTPANRVNPVEHRSENKRPFLSASIPKLGAPKPMPRNTKLVKLDAWVVVSAHSHLAAGPMKDSNIISMASHNQLRPVTAKKHI
jgi:hypothetical protein|tara:strand:- start:103 stop:705 length:603 start_codon:yes stop_codon:yes gene_type:complete